MKGFYFFPTFPMRNSLDTTGSQMDEETVRTKSAELRKIDPARADLMDADIDAANGDPDELQDVYDAYKVDGSDQALTDETERA